MNRTAQSQSFLLRIASWLFIASLICDSSNVDDLLCGCMVIHEDDEVINSSQLFSDGLNSVSLWCHSNPKGNANIREFTQLPRIARRFTLDQDSPSLASEGYLSLVEHLNPIIASGPTFCIRNLTTLLLHLRFHTLLI
jgi:hypothetical protein